MTHCYIKSIHGLNKNTFISWSAKKIQKSLKNNIFAIIRLVLQITEHLKRNVQTSIVPFLQNILMQQYWNIYASIEKVEI